jgi:uncharacterized membrane protein
VVFFAGCGLLPFAWWGVKNQVAAIVFYAVYVLIQAALARAVHRKEEVSSLRLFGWLASSFCVILVYMSFYAAFCALHIPNAKPA